MSPERTNAYRRVLQSLDELGPSKLQSGEQDRIREAADSLIFCQVLGADESARRPNWSVSPRRSVVPGSAVGSTPACGATAS